MQEIKSHFQRNLRSNLELHLTTCGFISSHVCQHYAWCSCVLTSLFQKAVYAFGHLFNQTQAGQGRCKRQSVTNEKPES